MTEVLIGSGPVGDSDWRAFLGRIRLGALAERRGLIVPPAPGR